MILSPQRLLRLNPGLARDLATMGRRIRDEHLVLDLRWEAMSAHAEVAERLRTRFRATEDMGRVHAIVAAIRHGGDPWPVVLDDATDDVVHGRHRIVAFHMLALGNVPVVRVLTTVPAPVSDVIPPDPCAAQPC